MLTKIVYSKPVEEIYYELCFDDGISGFGFPCDEDGNLLPGLGPEAMKNYYWCLENPEKFSRYNYVEERRITYQEPNYGICDCGETVVLRDEYLGACQCEKCGQWYSINGQELLSPQEWGWDGTVFYEDEY